MASAAKVIEPHPTKRPGRNEQLKIVSDEAEKVWQRHAAGEISSEEAAARLSELKRRYANFFDRLLDL